MYINQSNSINKIIFILMSKIKVKNPVVELDGDEMTRIIWEFIKNKLILPYLDLGIEYYDCLLYTSDAADES